MRPLQKLLVPTDFSESAARAVDVACELARRYEASVTLLYVYQPPTVLYPEMAFGATFDAGAQVLRFCKDALEQARAAAERALGRPVAAELATGAPHAEITRVAREGGFDLIVIGSHGRTGLAHALLGSVAERVVRKAPCSVFIARGAEAPKPVKP
jgi:nucleotide-binding universal stress UspA family protein